MYSFKELFEKIKGDSGIFIGVNFTDDTIAHIHTLQKLLMLKNPTPADELHTTLIYSKKSFPYDVVKNINVSNDIVGIRKFNQQNGKIALVLELSGEYVRDEHERLMSEHNLNYDYAEYIPHVTLTYDYVGESDILVELLLDQLYFKVSLKDTFKEELNLNKYK